ncbi:hypothetical protein PINS_up003905 [Pythium insidiosum]|nr:hypothetical protein PINS_up003905 [Pythium insidiosum]
MRKIMATRSRVLAMRGQHSGVLSEPYADVDGIDDESALLRAFASAVEAREKEQLVTIVTQSPRVVSLRNEVALHLACALVPNYFYVDLLDMMVQADPESPAAMDTDGHTPLHVLCQNPSVTCQALAVLVNALPAAAAMCDKRSSLALHYVCRNAACDVEMLRQLGQSDTYHMRDGSGRTPLHCLASAHTPFKKAAFLYLLQCHPDAAAVIDQDGRSVLHWVCEAKGFDAEVVNAVLKAAPSCARQTDNHIDLPLHVACQNDSISTQSLKCLLSAFPEAVRAETEVRVRRCRPLTLDFLTLFVGQNNLTPLHILCANDAVTHEMLTEFLAFDKANTTVSCTDTFGATPLHVLCMNDALTAAHLRALLLVAQEDAFAPDVDGKTPLHHLCANKALSAVTLEILADACPSAAIIADKEMRLPIQYLVDNPSSPPETTALLISGPSSYRLRYDFLSVIGGHAMSFLQNHELVYVQSNLAMDSKASQKVLIQFFSSASALEHDRHILARINAVVRI